MSGTDRLEDGVSGTSAVGAAGRLGRNDALGVRGFGRVGSSRTVRWFE